RWTIRGAGRGQRLRSAVNRLGIQSPASPAAARAAIGHAAAPPSTAQYSRASDRMRLARAQSSGSETLSPMRSSAGYTIDMHESDVSEATASAAQMQDSS